MKYRKRSKTKHEHSMIPGLRQFLFEELEPLDQVEAIIPGRISKTKNQSDGLRLRYKYPVRGGVRLLAYNAGAVQELFVVTDRPKSVKAKLREVRAARSKGGRRKHPAQGGFSEDKLKAVSLQFASQAGPADSSAFAPSSFQLAAMESIRRDDVIVVAPTGSGKTWIAERAVEHLLEQGGRCWYTTPLKALSNQKYDNFQRLFGAEKVGLLTGEREENASAPVIVATAEVFRNALYTRGEAPQLVVLDEAHYLGDEERGTTWEEIIILGSPQTRLLLLSATISNAEELADWMETLRGARPVLVQEMERPVPLQYGFRRGAHLLPLELKYAGAQNKIAPRAQSHFVRLVGLLEKSNLLPAIIFLPTRRECDQAAAAFQGYRAAGAADRFEAFSDVAETNGQIWKNALAKSLINAGVAAHHAGHLTEWKIAVERMLAAGQLRAVFATTTLAAGLDVPARTVVLPSLMTRDAMGARFLTPLEFHQMTGRAGRRGKDKVGFVIIDAIHPDDFHLALNLQDAEPDPIRSAFSISYYQVLNLIKRFGLDNTVGILDRSLLLFQQTSKRRFGKVRARVLGEMEKRIEILQKYGYLDREFEPTELGDWAYLIRHEQSLVLTEIVRRNLPRSLSPPELAAWAGAIGSGRAPEHVLARVDMKPLLSLVAELQKAERRRGLRPMEFAWEESWRKAGALKCWAEGREWGDLVLEAGIQEGDFQRVILQAAQILRELKNLPLPVADLAKDAWRLLLRPPLQAGGAEATTGDWEPHANGGDVA